MKRKTVFYPLLAIVIAAILVLAPACGSSSKTTTAAVPQILRVNLGSEPAQIDPNQASWAQEKSVVSQVFVGLLGFNQDLTLRADFSRRLDPYFQAKEQRYMERRAESNR
jgi:oligopeptide transport system substrate-binding protein